MLYSTLVDSVGFADRRDALPLSLQTRSEKSREIGVSLREGEGLVGTGGRGLGMSLFML